MPLSDRLGVLDLRWLVILRSLAGWVFAGFFSARIFDPMIRVLRCKIRPRHKYTWGGNSAQSSNPPRRTCGERPLSEAKIRNDFNPDEGARRISDRSPRYII